MMIDHHMDRPDQCAPVIPNLAVAAAFEDRAGQCVRIPVILNAHSVRS